MSCPRPAGDELFATYFAEITLDVVEEQMFLKRAMEEPGPRYVHVQLSAIALLLFRLLK